jgi:hypothetical protein
MLKTELKQRSYDLYKIKDLSVKKTNLEGLN